MSTSRYLNAGGPGVTTIVENMASRVKAWSNVNATGTMAIRASFGITSVTDGGTGNITNTFTNAFSSAEYGLAGYTGDTTAGNVGIAGSPITALAGSCTHIAKNGASTAVDYTHNGMQFCGTLA
jgi:hypothetical protein